MKNVSEANKVFKIILGHMVYKIGCGIPPVFASWDVTPLTFTCFVSYLIK